VWTVTPDCRLGWQCSTLGDVPPNIGGRGERQLTCCHTTGSNALGSASVAHYLPFVLQAWGGPKPLGQASLDQSRNQKPIALNRATENRRAAYSYRPLIGRGDLAHEVRTNRTASMASFWARSLLIARVVKNSRSRANLPYAIFWPGRGYCSISNRQNTSS
jgi:hypothetical protein